MHNRESISYNCVGEGDTMLLFSPPIVPESSAFTLFSTNPVQRCIVQQNKASATILVESPGNSSFTGTLVINATSQALTDEDY